jgi:hypothetical protein
MDASEPKRCRVCTEIVDRSSYEKDLCRHCEKALRALVDWPPGESESNWSALLREARRLRVIAYGPEPDWETMDPSDERWLWHDKHYWKGEHGPCSAICLTTGKPCQTTGYFEHNGQRLCAVHHPGEAEKRRRWRQTVRQIRAL